MKMKSTILLLFVAAVATLSSCEKVVNVDLNKAEDKYVIEAPLYEGDHPFKVRIFKTTDYYGISKQVGVNDAKVVIVGNGDSIVVPPIAEGEYELSSYQAIAGEEYQLSVRSGEKLFSATTTIPPHLAVDSIGYEFKEADFQNEGFEIHFAFLDPAQQQNNYRIKLTVNDTVQTRAEDLFLFDDKYNDGKPVKVGPGKRFKNGDRIEAELLSLDRQTYSYFMGLYDVLNNQNGPAPANPVTNIQGGALGYFGGFTSLKKGLLVIPTK
jgi:hypothetical protein